jgi:hypothetical protein
MEKTNNANRAAKNDLKKLFMGEQLLTDYINLHLVYTIDSKCTNTMPEYMVFYSLHGTLQP